MQIDSAGDLEPLTVCAESNKIKTSWKQDRIEQGGKIWLALAARQKQTGITFINTLQKFSTISVDKTVQNPTANSLTMLFQRIFPSSLIHEANFLSFKNKGLLKNILFPGRSCLCHAVFPSRWTD